VVAGVRVIPERLRRRPRRDPEGSMTLIEHLEELRFRLIIAVVAIAVGAVVGWVLYDRVADLLLNPYCDYYESIPLDRRPTPECTLFFSEALGAVLLKLKLVGYLGLFIALPVVLYQLWAFVVPGLTKRERRMAIPFVVSSVLLFALGALFAYWSLPKALGFLLGFAGDVASPLLTGDRFFSFVVLLAFVFGLSFEFPIALVFLQMAGVIGPTQLRGWRRTAILLIFVFAAVITPSGDPYTLLAMAVPMVLFYEAAIIVGRLMNR
jgi:sec-independent protein translocase protein TatC